MGGTENAEASNDQEELRNSGKSTLIFISHDSRDAELAEAFSELLRKSSAGRSNRFARLIKQEQKG